MPVSITRFTGPPLGRHPGDQFVQAPRRVAILATRLPRGVAILATRLSRSVAILATSPPQWPQPGSRERLRLGHRCHRRDEPVFDHESPLARQARPQQVNRPRDTRLPQFERLIHCRHRKPLDPRRFERRPHERGTVAIRIGFDHSEDLPVRPGAPSCHSNIVAQRVEVEFGPRAQAVGKVGGVRS